MHTVLFALISLLTPDAHAAKLNVVATVGDLGAIARTVGGEFVQVSVLSEPTQDPHFVDPRPSLALDLARADLLLAVGLELEKAWLPTLQVGSRNAKIQSAGRGYLEVSSSVFLLDVPTGAVDRSMGDIHAGGNPHFFYDPRSGAAIAMTVGERLAELDPTHADAYRSNAKALVTDLSAHQSTWEAQCSGLKGTKVVAYHKTLPYLANWLGFTVIEHLEPKPGVPPDPQHVAAVVARMRAESVTTVIRESYYPANTADQVAAATGARVVVLPPSSLATQTYPDHVSALVGAVCGTGK